LILPGASAALIALTLAAWALATAQPVVLPDIYRRGFPSATEDRWRYAGSDEYQIYEAAIRSGVDSCFRPAIVANRTGGWFGYADEMALDPELRDELRRVSGEVVHFDIERLRKSLPGVMFQDELDLETLAPIDRCVVWVSPIAFSQDRRRAVIMASDESDVPHDPYLFFAREGRTWRPLPK
jgi:hypothetical protein